MASSWKNGKSEHSHKQQQSIHDTIHLLLSLLSECGMPRVPSECFRRAKYNKVDAASDDLSKLTFYVMQVLMVLDGDMCDGNVTTMAYPPITASNLSTVQTILRHYMFELGYKREEFYVPIEAVGSREILLAFAWLLHRTSFFSKLSNHFIAIANTIEVPLRSASKHLIEHVMEENRVIGCELESTIAALRKCAESTSQTDRCIEALHQLVWLKGKLTTKFKSVQGLCSAYHSMANKVHKSTCANSTLSRRQGGKGHLSTHEVFLLRYPTQMKSYLAKLRRCVSVLQKIVQWQDCEPLFWQWMESILDMQEEEKERKMNQDRKEEGSDDINVVVTELEDVPALTDTVQKQREEFEDLLAKSKHRIDRVEHVWSQKLRILHNTDISSKLQFFRKQLQYEYPITVQSTNQTALVSSTVEQMNSIDCPVYAPSQAIVERPRHMFPTSVQLQQQGSDTMHIQALGRRLQAILNEVAVLDRVIKGKKTEIKDAVESLEKWLPASVCKIESNADL